VVSVLLALMMACALLSSLLDAVIDLLVAADDVVSAVIMFVSSACKLWSIISRRGNESLAAVVPHQTYCTCTSAMIQPTASEL